MAKLGISTGTVPNDGLGDSLLDGAVKINDNFDEIYTYFGDGNDLTFTAFSGDYGDLSNTPVNLSDFSNDVGFITSFIDTDTNYWIQTTVGIHTLSNVGIGTTNPTENLTVFGDARVTGILTIGTASITLDGLSNIITVGSGATINGSTGSITAISFSGSGTSLTTLNASNLSSGTVATARLGSGTANSSTYLRGDQTWASISTGISITNDTSTNSTFYPTFTSATSGTITGETVSSTKLTFNPSTGTLTVIDLNSTSDINLKTNIKTVENALETVNSLRGVSFDWKENGRSSYGVIAQELEEVLPELVSNGEIKTVNYNGIIGVLIEAIKELKAEIEDLKNS